MPRGTGVKFAFGLSILLLAAAQIPSAQAADSRAVERSYGDALRQIRTKTPSTSTRELGSKVVQSLNSTLGEGAKAKRTAAAARRRKSGPPKPSAKLRSSPTSSPSQPDTEVREPAQSGAAPILDESTIPRQLEFSGGAKGAPGATHTHSDPNQKLEELEF